MNELFNILVVDDDLKNIQVGINFLKQNSNYRLFFATSGKQALERVQDHAFDLILLDVIMPGMDGYDVCRKLKELDETRSIPVLFLTAKHGTENLVKGFEVGGADFITKPFNSHELQARVHTHLTLHANYKKEIKRLNNILYHSQHAENLSYLSDGLIHDTRNFLTSIFGNLANMECLLATPECEKEQVLNCIKGVRTAGKNINDLVNRFAEISTGRTAPQELFDLNEILKEVELLYKGSYRSETELVFLLADTSVGVTANKMQLEQVLLNMLINAERAILVKERGRGKIRVSLEIQDQPWSSIRVEDNGIGMSRELMDNIFKPYYSTKKDNTLSGLGLVVSDSIIKSHNGRIQVESVEGEGSCFSILLPVHEDCLASS